MDDYYLLDRHRAFVQKVVAWAYHDDPEMKDVEFWMRHIFKHEFQTVVVLIVCVVSYKTKRMSAASSMIQGASTIKRISF